MYLCSVFHILILVVSCFKWLMQEKNPQQRLGVFYFREFCPIRFIMES